MLYKAETSDIQMEELFAEVVILYLCFEDGLANIYSQALRKRCQNHKLFFSQEDPDQISMDKPDVNNDIPKALVTNQPHVHDVGVKAVMKFLSPAENEGEGSVR